jgi:Sec-independent protein translocase protein TatA
VQVGPLEIVIVLVIALLIFGGKFAARGRSVGGGLGSSISGRLRRTKDAVTDAGQELKEGYHEEPAGDSRVGRAARRSRQQVEAAGKSVPAAARGAKEGFVEEGPATSTLGRAAEGAGRRTRSGAETVAGTAASAGRSVAGTAASAGREVKAGLTGEESEANGRIGRAGRSGGSYLRDVGLSLSETGKAMREGLEGKDGPEDVVDEAPGGAEQRKAIEPPPADEPPAGERPPA